MMGIRTVIMNLNMAAISLPALAQWTTSGNNTILTNTGNVGIGTSTPSAKLSIMNGNHSGLHIRGNSEGWQGADLYVGRSTTSPIVGHSPSIQFGQDDNSAYGALLQSYQGQFQFFTANGNWIEAMRITTTGKVGIGITNPSSKFQIEGGPIKASLGSAGGSQLNYGTSYLGFNAARDNATWLIDGDGANNGGGIVYSNIFGEIYFSSIESNGAGSKILTDNDIKDRIRLRIAPDGSTHAKQIVVETTNWPDYIFRPGYRLPSLRLVQAFIKENRRLPEMPSEAEVAKEGINLGEIVKLQTKKIEELTLYLIDQNKRLKVKQEQIIRQQRQIQKINRKHK